MPYLPPVNIPQIAGNSDYARELYAMTAGVGDTVYGIKRDKIGDQQWQQDYARQIANDQRAQANADRNYALDLRKLEEGGGDEYGLSPFYLEDNQGNLVAAQTRKGGGYSSMDLPEGYKVAPGTRDIDGGTYIATVDRAGNVIATRPKQGNMQPGYVQQGGMSPDGVPQSVAPMAGSPDAVERRLTQTKARGTLDSVASKAATVTGFIDDALKKADSGWATGTGGALMGVAGTVVPTSRNELINDIESIKAHLSIKELGEMRANSPTGGALGNVTDFENRLLAATAGPLDPMQPEQMKATLKNIKRQYKAAVVAHRIAYMTDFEGLDRATADEAINLIRGGKDPDWIMEQIQKNAGGR